MLNTLHRNVHHLEALVKKVIEESTNLGTEVGVKLERWEFDLWPLVESLIVDLHTVAGTGSTRLTNAVPEDFVVYADASLVRRVLQNLIANAITHTPSGEVIIGAKNTEPAGDVECFVQDSGRGIPPERCQSVFEKYETDRENEGGLGVGSTFRFTLPGKKA